MKLEKDWEEVKELLKEVNTDLNDDDLEYTPGQEDVLLRRLAVKMNRTEDQVKVWIESVSHNEGKAS